MSVFRLAFMKTYRINEIFYSLQGEGIRQGTPNVFIRFSGCNLKCAEDDPHSGFNCDTEFVSGVPMTIDDICAQVGDLCPSVILTGGEPALQVDQELIDELHRRDFYIAIETNGTQTLPDGIDWICVSPKSAEHTLKIELCDELKYVRHKGQGIPKPSITADHYLISPAFKSDGSVSRDDLEYCIALVKLNPTWRLSVQLHKILYRVR